MCNKKVSAIRDGAILKTVAWGDTKIANELWDTEGKNIEPKLTPPQREYGITEKKREYSKSRTRPGLHDGGCKKGGSENSVGKDEKDV